MDKLNAISVFCKVVETQSFTQAAAQQNMSVAMASKLVSQLEETLKVRLLQRTTRKIVPTEAGILYYQRCQPILLELNDAEASISSLSTALQGNLVVSVPMDFGYRFIAPSLPRFVQAHPNLHIDIEYSDRKVDLVAEGYDIALRIGYLQDSTLVAKKIAGSTMHFAASPDYLKKHGIPQIPEELEHHDCLLYKALGNQVYWTFNNQHHIEKVKMNSKLICNNGLTLTQLAKSGLGIINSPYFLIDKELQSGELVEILADYRQQELDLHLIYPNRRHLPAKVRAFIDFIESLHLATYQIPKIL
ncbi:MAG: LysR family transcriptional regulator [Lonepinella koalarum]|nr:LysR family transcriptional regulator [Lonepinella koalarum]